MQRWLDEAEWSESVSVNILPPGALTLNGALVAQFCETTKSWKDNIYFFKGKKRFILGNSSGSTVYHVGEGLATGTHG